MRKQYQIAQVEILPIESFAMMIPGSDPPNPAPKRNWVPGPGSSYDPQGSVV